MQTPLNWTELIPFYIARTLPSDQMKRFEAQLARDPQLQQEVAEWRRIASAVWQEADSVARQVPPLAPSTLQKLTPRSSAAVPSYATPPSETTRTNLPRIVRQSRETSTFTLTLVAGLLLAFLCGGFLVLLAVNWNQNRVEVIAGLGTPSGIGGGGDFGSGSDGNATPTRTLTESDLVALTQTAISHLTQPTIQNPITPTATAILMMTPTPQPSFAPPTLSPVPTQVMLVSGACTVTNASAATVILYTTADRAAGVFYEMQPNESFQPFQRTNNGWFGILIEGAGMGWVNTADVVVTGNCDPLPFPTEIPLASATSEPVTVIAPAEAQVAVVTAAFADLRAAPGVQYEVLLTVSQGYRLTVLGYEQTSGWIQVNLPDERQAWVNPASVTIESATTFTATPAP